MDKKTVFWAMIFGVVCTLGGQGFNLINNTNQTLYVEFKKFWNLKMCDQLLGSLQPGAEELHVEVVEPGSTYDWSVANYTCACVAGIQVKDAQGTRIDQEGGSIMLTSEDGSITYAQGIPDSLFSCGTPTELETYLMFIANPR